MRRCLLAFLGVIASFVVLTSASIAAQQGVSEIRGRVSDTQNAIMPGVTVVVTNQDTGLYREVISNSDGTFFVTGIVPGTYEVAAQLSGFKKSVRRDIVLSVGRTTTVDLQLEVGGIEETVTVTTQAPLVDATSPEIGGNVTNEDMAAMPSVNRNYIEFLGLLPGVVPNSSTISFGADTVNVNGQNSASNNYMVDGGNNNDDYLGQGFGSQARTALESIQEFQVLTNQDDAEFGRTTGGVVNAVTKQGSNQFHGSAFNFWTGHRGRQTTRGGCRNDAPGVVREDVVDQHIGQRSPAAGGGPHLAVLVADPPDQDPPRVNTSPVEMVTLHW